MKEIHVVCCNVSSEFGNMLEVIRAFSSLAAARELLESEIASEMEKLRMNYGSDSVKRYKDSLQCQGSKIEFSIETTMLSD